MLADDFLPGVGVQELQIRFRRVPGALALDVGIDPGDVRLGFDAERRIDNFQGALGFLHFEMGFILPGQVDVAQVALGEGHGRAARPGVEHQNIVIERADEVLGVLFAAAALPDGAPGREKTQLAVAGDFRVRRDDADAGLDEIGPIADVLGIALAHDEDDRREVGERAVRQPLFPLLGKQVLAAQRVGVRPEGKGHHVGGQTVNHGPRLAAGTAVRLLDRHAPAGLLFVIVSERLVQLPPQLTRGIVGGVEQRDLVRLGARAAEEPDGAAQCQDRRRSENPFGPHRITCVENPGNNQKRRLRQQHPVRPAASSRLG